MTKTADLTGLGARAELREWYFGHLRPMLEEAIADSILEPAALEALDYQLGDFFEETNFPGDAA